MDEAIGWLRQQVTQRLETARKASHGSDGRWVGREQTKYGPHGHLRDNSGEVVVYDEGSPSDCEFEHIALNDPQDVIARCEAELGILNLHQHERLGGRTAQRNDLGCALCHEDDGVQWHPGWCDTVKAVASGYRHRDGYTQHWG